MVDFKSREGGQIEGTKLHCLVDAAQGDYFEGKKVETLFLPKGRFPSVKVHLGDQLAVYFNRYGKVDGYESA